MRKICDICGKKEGILLSHTMHLLIDKVCYCKDCYDKKYGALEFHPIPDAMLPGPMDSINHTVLSDSEIEFCYTHFNTRTQIHILMYHTQAGGFPYHIRDKLIGIDRYSGRLVYVDYDDDSEYSRGVSAKYLTDEQFFAILNTYPKQIREIFADFSSENSERFLNVYVPMDTSPTSHLVMREYDICAKIAYISDSWGWFYAELPIDQYRIWKNGKSFLERIASLKELPQHATKCSPCADKHSGFALSLYLPRMKLFKPIASALEECVKVGTPASADTANCVYIKQHSKYISELCVPDSIIESLFAYMEQNLNVK